MAGIFVLIFMISVFYVVKVKLNQSFLVAYTSAFFGIALVMFVYNSNSGRSESNYSEKNMASKKQQYQNDVNQTVVSVPPPLKETQYFHNVACTDDCSGHAAGYEWAKNNNIIASSLCSGKSNSFIEGCKVYVNEHPQNRSYEYNSQLYSNQQIGDASLSPSSIADQKIEPITTYTGKTIINRREDSTISLSGNTEIEMRGQFDLNPANKYRGEIDSDGYVRMRNFNGDTLRGYIDSDGYGRLRDQNGNSYRVKP